MRGIFKKFTSILVSWLIILNTVNVGYAQDQNFYVPDKKFKVITQYTMGLIGRTHKFKFKNPNETSKEPLEYELFPDGSPKPEDIVQGNSGLCYLLSVLCSIAKNQPGIIKNAIVDNKNGTVTVKLYDPISADPMFITVDRTVPDLPKTCKIIEKECLWVHMMIKALIAANIEARACTRIFKSMEYKNIEGGFPAVVIRMITGKECRDYNDVGLAIMGENRVYETIKKNLKNGPGIMTCDFNYNRIVAMVQSMLLLVPDSYNGLVFGHAYSIIDAFEDENHEKWIVVKNPWGSFGCTYNERGKLCLKTNDGDSDGYSKIKLKDFYRCCGTLQVSTENKLKPMTRWEKFRELTHKTPFIAVLSLVLALIMDATSVINQIIEKVQNDMITGSESEEEIESDLAYRYVLSMFIMELIFW